MIKIAICDDEAYFCREIQNVVSAYLKSNHIEYEITIFSSGNEFAALDADMAQYQIVYLDINMEGIDGIETAKKLRQWCENSYIVFVTAYNTYAREGYKVEAIRYILKNSDDLKENVEESLEVILDKMAVNTKVYELDFKEGRRKFSAEQIIYAESSLRVIAVHIKEKGGEQVYTYPGKLDEFEAWVSDSSLLRIHQSILVNMKYISDLTRQQVILHNGSVLPIARARKDYVKEKYLFYEGEC